MVQEVWARKNSPTSFHTHHPTDVRFVESWNVASTLHFNHPMTDFTHLTSDLLTGVVLLQEPGTVSTTFHNCQLLNACHSMLVDDARTSFHTKSLCAAQTCHTSPTYLDFHWCKYQWKICNSMNSPNLRQHSDRWTNKEPTFLDHITSSKSVSSILNLILDTCRHTSPTNTPYQVRTLCGAFIFFRLFQSPDGWDLNRWNNVSHSYKVSRLHCVLYSPCVSSCHNNLSSWTESNRGVARII